MRSSSRSLLPSRSHRCPPSEVPHTPSFPYISRSKKEDWVWKKRPIDITGNQVSYYIWTIPRTSCAHSRSRPSVLNSAGSVPLSSSCEANAHSGIVEGMIIKDCGVFIFTSWPFLSYLAVASSQTIVSPSAPHFSHHGALRIVRSSTVSSADCSKNSDWRQRDV